LHEAAKRQPLKLLLAGFGVGFSWAACCLTLKDAAIEPVFPLTLS